MNEINFYRHQSIMSDPGKWAHVFDELPSDPKNIHTVIHGLLLHFADIDIFSINITLERLSNLELRYVESMLTYLLQQQDNSLLLQRAVQHRIIASCRDFALLFCAILRHHGIPARCRVAFNAYFYGDILHDQVIVEYWHQVHRRWCLIDPRLNEQLIEAHGVDVDFDLYDVPNDRLILAGDAWLLAREGVLDPARCFGRRSSHYCGLWYLRDRLVQDFAAINGVEMQLWDCWGMLLGAKDIDSDKVMLSFLDKLAYLSLNVDPHFGEIQALYHHCSQLLVPDTIEARGPYVRHRSVNLRAESKHSMHA